jgi:hypothetical protein
MCRARYSVVLFVGNRIVRGGEQAELGRPRYEIIHSFLTPGPLVLGFLICSADRTAPRARRSYANLVQAKRGFHRSDAIKAERRMPVLLPSIAHSTDPRASGEKVRSADGR